MAPGRSLSKTNPVHAVSLSVDNTSSHTQQCDSSHSVLYGQDKWNVRESFVGENIQKTRIGDRHQDDKEHTLAKPSPVFVGRVR